MGQKNVSKPILTFVHVCVGECVPLFAVRRVLTVGTNTSLVYRLSFLSQSVLRQIHSLLQNGFSTDCDVVLPLLIFSILSFPLSHPIAAYVFFLFSRPFYLSFINRLTPNDPYMGSTAPLTSKRCILYIYSTNIGAEYFKHALYSPFYSLQNAVCFIMLTCLVPVLFAFYIQGVLKLKK